jgi:hypothetical protein
VSRPADSQRPGEEASEEKRNARLVIANGALMQMSMSFASSDTVLPAFMQMVTGSSVMVGAARAIMHVGWSWPQVFISRVIESRPRKMGVMLAGGFARSGIWILLAVATFLTADAHGFWYLGLFFLMYATSSSLSGVTNVPWMDIIGKSVPSERRVRVFALRRLVGGLLAMATGVVVSYVLSRESGLSFPQNYGLLFLLSGVILAASIASFGLIRERVEEVRDERLPLCGYLASGVRLLREDDDYRRLLLLRYLWAAGMMGSSFYVPYAIADLGMSVAYVGLFVSVTQLSAFLSNALWAWVGDRRGNCALMVYGTWFMALAAVVPLATPHVPSARVPMGWAGIDLDSRVLFLCLAFLFQGFAHSGTFTGRMAFVLDISPPDRRPTYTAFLNTFGVPGAALPIVAGALAGWLSYPIMFVISLAFAPLALMLAARMAAQVRGRQG